MSAFSAARWRRLVAKVASDRPVAGRNCELSSSPAGTTVHGETLSGEPPHAWQLRPRWDVHPLRPREFVWQATVYPGFVNGRDASIGAVPLLADPAPVLLFTAWRDPLRGGSVQSTSAGDLVASAPPPYPRFFERLGVKPQSRGGSLTQPGALNPPDDALRTRELRACDVALVVPRIGSRQTVQILDPIANAQTILIDTTLVTDVLDRSVAPYELQAVPLWQPPQEPSALERLQGTESMPQTDEIRLATLWMVSPPDGSIDSVPDGTWTPYPQHFVFYNLGHGAEIVPPRIPFSPLRLVTGLAGGLADPIFASLLRPGNDLSAAVYALLSRTDFKGGFWGV